LKREDIKIGIIRIEGTNCEQESYEAFKRLDSKPEFIHLKQLLKTDCSKDEQRNISDFQCLMIPGGFSSGDYIRAGAIFAARIKSKLGNDLTDFINEGFPLFGICNGFQVLTELGLLPGIKHGLSKVPTACLHINDSDRFECRPTFLKHENKGSCVFTNTLKKNEIRMIPSAHAEGKLILSTDKPKKAVKDLSDNDQIVFRYVNEQGDYDGYPWNPNGSFDDIAGICNLEGNVFGMMPHPERVFYQHQHPDWTTAGLDKTEGDGRALFESVLRYIEKKF